MKKYSGGVQVPTGFKKLGKFPGFDDQVVEFLADLDNTYYEGSVVYVISSQLLYVKRSDEWTPLGFNLGTLNLGFHPVKIPYAGSNTFPLPNFVVVSDVRKNGDSSDINWTQSNGNLVYQGDLVMGDELLVFGTYSNVPVGTIPDLNMVTGAGSITNQRIQSPDAINPQDLVTLKQVQDMISAIEIP